MKLNINNSHRATVAKAWREARALGEDQVSFCARQMPQIKPRTLRQWCRAFPAITTQGAPSNIQLVASALANLRMLANALEASRLGPPVVVPAMAVGPASATGAPRPLGLSFWDDLES